jgi:hypothetical protein
VAEGISEAVIVDLTELERWNHAVELQARRVGTTGEPFDAEPDVFFLVLAAHMLRRSAHSAARRHSSARSAIDQAIAVFDNTLDYPLNDVRDYIAHFDAYIRGEGNDAAVSQDFNPVTWTDDHGNVMVVLTSTVSVDAQKLIAAVRTLCAGAQKALKAAALP